MTSLNRGCIFLSSCRKVDTKKPGNCFVLGILKCFSSMYFSGGDDSVPGSDNRGLLPCCEALPGSLISSTMPTRPPGCGCLSGGSTRPPFPLQKAEPSCRAGVGVNKCPFSELFWVKGVTGAMVSHTASGALLGSSQAVLIS